MGRKYLDVIGVSKNTIGFLLIFLIMPNLPVWLSEKKMWLYPHGYINTECLLVGILALFVPRGVTFLLLFLEMLSAFIYLICYTYQFSLKSLWASLHSLSLLPVGRISLVLAALTTIFVIAAVVAYGFPYPKGRSRIGAAAVLLMLFFLLISIDTFDGRNPILPRDVFHRMPRLALMPLLTLGEREIRLPHVDAAGNLSAPGMDSASAKGIGFLGHTPVRQRPNVVLVVVESWGLLRDARLNDALDAGYRDARLTGKYRVTTGTAPFDGLTVPGEARELCHSHIGFGLLTLADAEKNNCLPALFHSYGYQNIAIHGYVGGMFQRDSWYKSIGFDQRWFSTVLGQAGLPYCDGAFPGICDGAIAGWIGHTLLSGSIDRPRFIYWLTLNSHLPVSENPDLPPDQNCTLHPELANSKSLCSWFRLISTVHHSVQHLALEPQIEPTVFILVGDHAPPFADPHLRQLFSSVEVPYIILTPAGISQ